MSDLPADPLLASASGCGRSGRTLAQYEVGKVTLVSVLEANAGFIFDQDDFGQVLAQTQRLQVDAAEASLDSVEPGGGVAHVVLASWDGRSDATWTFIAKSGDASLNLDRRRSS